MKISAYQSFFWAASVCLSSVLACGTVRAQISPDGTLPTKVRSSGTDIEITGGARAGNNLFHSFEKFSVPNSNHAIFNNAANIRNIIGRVTGGSISKIDGLIKANGGANLILLNPNGIHFGANAQLDIGGSFLGSTASSLKFADGSEFSAINPQTAQITVSVPVGLQFGQNPGSIRVNGNGHDFTIDQSIYALINRNNSVPTGLQVKPGQTLALIGSDLTLDGGTLTAPGGQIELGSVGTGSVGINSLPLGWTFNYTGVSTFGDITLSNQSLADISGIGAGSINIQGKNIALSDRSLIINDALSLVLNDELIKQIIGEVDLKSVFDANQSLSLTLAKNGGVSGNITINAANLTVTDHSLIKNFSALSEDIATLEVKTDTVTIDSEGGITASTLSGKNDQLNELDVKTRQLSVRDFGFISAISAGQGNGTNLTIDASESIELIGKGYKNFRDEIIEPAIVNEGNQRITPKTDGTGILIANSIDGQPGAVKIKTPLLILREGAIIFSPTFGGGQGGNLSIYAPQSVQLFGSGILTGTFESAGAGSISIETEELKVRKGSLIISAALGDGDGGDIDITAFEYIDIMEDPDVQNFRVQTGIYTNTSGGTGEGGDIRVSTGDIKIKKGVIASNSGAFLSVEEGFPVINPVGGSGGNVTVEATGSIEMSSVSRLGFPSGIGTTTFSNSDAGDLSIRAGQLVASEGADVTSATLNSGNGGDLTIDAKSIDLIGTRGQNDSVLGGIIASSGRSDLPIVVATGNAGDITITTEELTVRDGARIDVQSLFSGSAGRLEVEADSVLLDNNASISAATASGTGGNIELRVKEDIIWRRNSQTTATATGTADGGNIDIEAEIAIASGGSSIIASAEQGKGGRIDIDAEVLLVCPDCLVDASSELGVDGEVEINTVDTDMTLEFTEVPEELIDPEQIVALSCAANGNQANSEFTIIGRGGLPPRPTEPLSPQALVSFELETESAEDANLEATSENALPAPARGWYVEEDKLVLAAQLPGASPYEVGRTSASCDTP